MNIAPIITGSKRISKYDIPPHHSHETAPINGGTNIADQVEVDPLALDSGKDLVDFGEADDVLGPVGLIPTNREITSTTRSTRPEAVDKARHWSGSGATSLSARSASSGKFGHDDDDSDEFIDAEEV